MNIIFADLAHDGHPCNFVPYGISLVAASALAEIGPEISARLVKKPAELAALLEEGGADMVCFSLYLWNEALSCAFARRIKAKCPGCITVFGGRQYPHDAADQRAFLQSHPEIDFFVPREGEKAFVRLYQTLALAGFRVERLKGESIQIPGCHYLRDGILVAGPPLPPVEPLDALPSPYLAGLLDRFLDEGHPVIMETVRGCPFSCTFCQEGDDCYNAVRRYSSGRIRSELEYVAPRAKSAALVLADSNFGMYGDDMATAFELARMQEEHGWPGSVLSIAGKNNKDQVLRTAGPIRGAMLSAAIQSSDPSVLENIRRKNVSLPGLIESANENATDGSYSFSEIIVALPGDTYASHCRSASDLIDAGIQVVRSHQLLMLPGAEISSAETRSRFGLQTRFRVTPHTVDPCTLFGETFHAPEIDEVCVAGNSLTFQEYLDCRHFDLTVELFYNYGIFAELQAFLTQQGVSVASYIVHLNEIIPECRPVAAIYAGFLADTQELWQSREELERFLARPGVLERYQKGELGRNEQLAYKGYAVIEQMGELIWLAYAAARDLLSRHGELSLPVADYLDQLQRFDRLRKQEPMAAEGGRYGRFHYDFCGLRRSGFKSPPWEYRLAHEAAIGFSSTEAHRRFVAGVQDILGLGFHGYAAVISRNPKIADYFRDVSAEEGG